MMRFDRELFSTGIRRLKLLLRYEFLKTMNRSWFVFSRLVGLLAIAGIILTIPRGTAGDYIELLLPGLATVFLLHPFLKAGKVFAESYSLPTSWRDLPVPQQLFVFCGLPGELVLNLGGLLIFFLLMTAGGYSTAFLVNPYYWLFYFSLLPGALGWGLVLNSLGLLVEEEKIAPAGRRVIEWLGGVFVLADWLPTGLYQLSFIFPHSYLAGLGRELVRNQQPGSLFYPAGAAVSFTVLLVGVVVFQLVLERALQDGKIDRNTR